MMLLACEGREPCGDDAIIIDRVLAESGQTVSDSSGAREIFQSYVEVTIAAADTFPDGASRWVYVESTRLSLGGTTVWEIEYSRDPEGERFEGLAVDTMGRLVLTIIAVHAPC